jgi:hypothetical protein
MKWGLGGARLPGMGKGYNLGEEWEFGWVSKELKGRLEKAL